MKEVFEVQGNAYKDIIETISIFSKPNFPHLW